MTATESQGTAEDYIRERLKVLEGFDQPAPTKHIDIFERATIAELKEIRTLIQKENMERGRKLKLVKIGLTESNPTLKHTYAGAMTVLTKIIAELEGERE